MILKSQNLKSRTYNYLFPALKTGYDTTFRDFMHGISRRGGIVDVYLDDINNENIRTKYCLYVLFDSKKLNDPNKAYVFLKNHVSYEYDYEVEEYQMFVLKLPESKYKAYDKFIASQYSQMYTKEELKVLYQYFDNPHPYKVIIKDEKVAKELLLTLGYEDINSLASEYDSIIDEREFFNNPETSHYS